MDKASVNKTIEELKEKLDKDREIVVELKVITKAKESRLVGQGGVLLKASVKAPPEKGKANQELIKLVSKTFQVIKQNVTIIKGKQSHNKTIKILK